MHALPVILCIFLTIILIVVCVWYVTSVSHYSWTLLKPGDTYMAAGNKHVMPNVDTYGPTYLLKDNYLYELRELITRVGCVLERLEIEWWVTGGTLLGAHMYGAIPMPFDDDADIGVDNKHRNILFSSKFVSEAKKEGLRVLYLRGASHVTAERVGACVRCQLDGRSATLDIFFWKTLATGDIVIKLDGWDRGVDVHNEKEQFRTQDVFPIRNNIPCDSLSIGLPQNPHNLLTTQYGDKVFTKTIARSLFVSHASPFVLLKAMWTTTPPIQ